MERVRLEVVLMADGSLRLGGPLDDRMLCYGMLEMAKEVLADRHRKATEGPRVEVARGPLLLNGG